MLLASAQWSLSFWLILGSPAYGWILLLPLHEEYEKGRTDVKTFAV